MTDDLARLAGDLRGAGKRATVQAFKDTHGIVREGRDKARSLAPHGPHTPHYRDAITSEVRVVRGGFVAEWGPDKDLPQGALGNIFEFGTATNSPQPHNFAYADQAVDDLADVLGRAGGGVL